MGSRHKFFNVTNIIAFYVIPGLCLLYWCFFLSTFYENSIIADDLNFFAPMLDKLTQSFSFDVLKVPQGHYGLIFYKLSAFINLRYFGWDTTLFTYGGLVVRFVSLILLLKVLQNAFKFNNRQLLLFSLLVSIALFSTAKIRSFNYVMISWYPTFEFIFTVLIYRLLFLYIQNKRIFSSMLLCFIVLCSIQTFLFSSPTFLINFASMSIYCLIAMFIFEEKVLILKKITLLFTTFLGLFASYYWVFLKSASGSSSFSKIITKLKDFDLLEFGQYFSYGLMTGLFHTHTLTLIKNQTLAQIFSRENLAIFGAIVFVIFLFGIFGFFRHKLYKASIIPFLLILDTFVAIALTFILRGINGSVELALSPRYGDFFSKGYVGLVIIGCYLLFRVSTKVKIWTILQKTLLVVLLSVFVSVNLYSAKLSLGFFSAFVSKYYDNISDVYKIDNESIPETSLKKTLYCNKPIDDCRYLIGMIQDRRDELQTK